MVVLTLAIAEYAAVHLLPGVGRAWRSAGRGAPIVLAIALALEVASVVSYSVITAILLPARPRLRFATVLAIDVTGMGFSHAVPGGGASAAALRVRLWTRRGLRAADAVSTGAVEYAATVIWLIAMLLVGIVAAAPHPGTVPLLRAALIVSVVLLMGFGAIIAVLAVRPDAVVAVTQAASRRLPGVSAEVLERVVGALIDQVHLAFSTPARGRRVMVWGLLYWLLDAASLFLCVLAFGHLTNIGGLLTTYALVNLLALIPITPGGLGLVEGVGVPTLVSFGVDPAAALLGVLSWRLLEFWLPIPIALGTYAWLRSSSRVGRTPAIRPE